MKVKPNEQSCFHDTQEVFEPPIDQQKKSTEKLTKLLKTGNGNLGNTILEGLENYDEIIRGKNKVLTKLTNSNVIGASIVNVPTDLMKSKLKFIIVQLILMILGLR